MYNGGSGVVRASSLMSGGIVEWSGDVGGVSGEVIVNGDCSEADMVSCGICWV